jgi:hypothetical protein
MFQPERTRVSRWTRLRSFAVGKYKAVQLSIERRSFEGKLERIVRTALAHQSVGLPAGHPQYKLLREQADSTCANFARRWNITPDLLDAQIPAIRKLKSLADPSPKPEPALLVSLGMAGVVALFFLVGILAGLTSVGYHLIGGR